HSSSHSRHLHSFPTRRSSDLETKGLGVGSCRQLFCPLPKVHVSFCGWIPGSLTIRTIQHIRLSETVEKVLRKHQRLAARSASAVDRKSTRLNSSHQIISYAVF